jgi:two-component system OmpR family response regulator
MSPAPGQALRVLVVDDDAMYLELVERSLKSFNIEVTTTDSAIGVTNLIRRTEPDVVLLDVNIPALSGDMLLGIVRKHAPVTTKFILFSSSDEATLRKRAADCRADGWISKSAEASTLATYIERAAKR